MTAYKGPHLVVAVEVSHNKLALRQALAEAKVENGDTIEVATSFSGHVLVTVHYKKKNKGWCTYAISPSALVEAVLVADGLVDSDPDVKTNPHCVACSTPGDLRTGQRCAVCGELGLCALCGRCTGCEPPKAG